MKLTFWAAVVLAIAGTAACNSSDEPDTTPASTATTTSSAPGPVSHAASRMPDAAANSSAASRRPVREPALNPDAARNIQPFERTGVAACDTYADVVTQCINVHTVGMQRRDLRIAFSHAVDDWRAQLNGGSSEAEVAKRCAAFRESFRSDLRSAGCSGG